jgi:hypothetical protein
LSAGNSFFIICLVSSEKVKASFIKAAETYQIFDKLISDIEILQGNKASDAKKKKAVEVLDRLMGE